MSSRFTQMLADSPLKRRIPQIKSTLEGLNDEQLRAADGVPPGEVVSRLSTVIGWADALLTGVDPRLLSPAMLEGADVFVHQIETALNAYVEAADEAQLNTIDSACSELAVVLGGWPGSGPFSKAAIQRLTDTFGVAAEQRIAVVRRDAERATEELRDRFAAFDARLEEVRTGVQEMESGVSERQNQLEAHLTTVQEQAGSLISSTEAALSGIRETQQGRFDVLAGEIQDRAQSAATEQRGRLEALEQALGERATSLMDTLEAQSDEAKGLLDVVATSATAGAFGKEADSQKIEADRWRVHATKVAIAAGVVGFLSVLSGVLFETSATLIATKVAFTAVVAGIAGYAAGQSAQHRKREVRARRLYLELTAFGPFAEPLVAEDRALVRKEFIARLFVGDPQALDGEVALTKENISLLGQLANVLQRG